MEYLLDTNILIGWFTTGPAQQFLEREMRATHCLLSTSWICAAEFLVKAGKKESTALLNLFECGDLLLYEVGGVEDLQDVSAIRRRTRLPLPDCIIIATAARHKATLLTHDAELLSKGKRIYSRIVDPAIA